MDIKINREIRNYTESMFFGLSMRQFVFAVIGIMVLFKPYSAKIIIIRRKDAAHCNAPSNIIESYPFIILYAIAF